MEFIAAFFAVAMVAKLAYMAWYACRNGAPRDKVDADADVSGWGTGD